MLVLQLLALALFSLTSARYLDRTRPPIPKPIPATDPWRRQTPAPATHPTCDDLASWFAETLLPSLSAQKAKKFARDLRAAATSSEAGCAAVKTLSEGQGTLIAPHDNLYADEGYKGLILGMKADGARAGDFVRGPVLGRADGEILDRRTRTPHWPQMPDRDERTTISGRKVAFYTLEHQPYVGGKVGEAVVIGPDVKLGESVAQVVTIIGRVPLMGEDVQLPLGRLF